MSRFPDGKTKGFHTTPGYQELEYRSMNGNTAIFNHFSCPTGTLYMDYREFRLEGRA